MLELVSARVPAVNRFAVRLVLAAGACLALAPAAATASPWSAAQQLEPPRTNTNVSNPTVAEAPDGTVVAVYAANDGSQLRVYAAVRPAGGQFGAPSPISPSTETATLPTVAIDANGNATVAWIAHSGAVEASYRPAGGNFPATPQTISSSGISLSTAPQLGVAANGVAGLTWLGSDGTHDRVGYAIRPAGATTFGAAALAPGPNGIGLFSPKIGADDAGDVALLWQEGLQEPDSKQHYVMLAAVKPVNAAMPSPTTLSTDYNDTSTTDELPGYVGSTVSSLVMTPSGRLFAAWDYSTTQSGSPSVVQFAERASSDASALWSNPQTLPDSTGGSKPVAAGDGHGGITIAYIDNNAVQASVRTNASSGFQLPKVLSNTNIGTILPAVAEAPTGAAVVAWRTVSGYDSALDAAQLTPGADRVGDTTEFASLHGTAAQSYAYVQPSIGLDAEGNGSLLVTLSTQGTTTYATGPEAFLFDPVPPSLGAVNVPVAGTTGSGVAMSASATDRSGTPTVTWNFGDGSTATGAAVNHAYGAPGAYAVTLQAADAYGNTSSATKTILVAAATPVVTPIVPIVKLPALTVTAKLKTSGLKNGNTHVTSLTLSPLRAGDVAKIVCAGKGCTKKASATVTFRPKTPKPTKKNKHPKTPTSLTVTGVAGLSLKPGATLSITVARAGYTDSTTTFTVQPKGKHAKQS